MSILGTKKRRVFFSFHYQNDIWRANQVRNSWRYGRENDREGYGFFDASIWETAKRTNDDSLKSLIRTGIQNSSVTCLLSGRETYRRRWVLYEIARSVIKGNALLNVSISNLRDRSGNTDIQGPNPLDYMGVYRDNGGSIRLASLVGTSWARYEDYTQSVELPLTWSTPQNNTVTRISAYCASYCYVRDAGSANFGSWVRNAAAMVGR